MNQLTSLIFIISSIFITNTYSATKCIAHRGDNKYFFENSVSSLLSAINKGAHGVEFDIVHTLDNIPIVIHDKKLKRLAMSKQDKSCPLKKKVSQLRYSEIQSNCVLKNGEEIPTLREFLTILSSKDIMRFIEFKDRPTKETFDLIEEFNEQNPQLLRLIAFKKSSLKKAYKLSKTNPFWRDVKLLALYRQTWRANKKYGVNIHHSSLRYINKYKKNGREVGIWTADSEKLFRIAKYKKVDFITTNDPEKCVQLISSNQI